MSDHMRVMALLGSLGPDWSDWVAQLLAKRPIAQVTFQEVCIRIRTERTRREKDPQKHATSSDSRRRPGVRPGATQRAQASSSKAKPTPPLKQSQLSLRPSDAAKDGAEGRSARGSSRDTPTPAWPQDQSQHSYTSFFKHRPSPATTNERSEHAYRARSASSYVGKGKGRAYDTPSTTSFVQQDSSTTRSSPQLERRPSHIFLPSRSSTDFQNSSASISSCRTPTSSLMPPPSTKPTHGLAARQTKKAQNVLQDKPFKIWTPETMSKRIAQPKRSATKSIATMFVMPAPTKTAVTPTMPSQLEAARPIEHEAAAVFDDENIAILNLSPATATSYHSLPRGSPRRISVSSSDESELFTTPQSTLGAGAKPRDTTPREISAEVPLQKADLRAATRVTEMFTKALAEKKPGHALSQKHEPLVKPGEDRPFVLSRPSRHEPEPSLEHATSPSALMMRRIRRTSRRPILSDSVLSQCLIQSDLALTPTPQAPHPVVSIDETTKPVRAGKLKPVRRKEITRTHNMLSDITARSRPVSKSQSSKDLGQQQLEFVYSSFMDVGTDAIVREGNTSIVTSARPQTPCSPFNAPQNKELMHDVEPSTLHAGIADSALFLTQGQPNTVDDPDPSSVQVCASIEDEPMPTSRKRTASSPDHDLTKRLKFTDSASMSARISSMSAERMDNSVQEAPAIASPAGSHPTSECGPANIPANVLSAQPSSIVVPASPREEKAASVQSKITPAEAALPQQATLSLDDLARTIAALRAAGLTALPMNQIVLPTTNKSPEEQDSTAKAKGAGITDHARAKKISKRRERRKAKRERARLATQGTTTIDESAI